MAFRFRFVSATFLLIGVSASALPQQKDIRFQRLSLEQGLSQSSVFAIAQDQKGFMWFATQDGLNRYDGYSFAHFSHDDHDSASLSDNYVNALLEDREGNLWAGTRGGGLDRYLREAGKFARYRAHPGDSRSLSNDEVRCLYEDRAGTIWIGTTNGLDRYDGANNSFVRFDHDPSNRRSLPAPLVESLFEDRAGNFWVGMLGALARLDRSTGVSTVVPLPVPGALCVWIAEDDAGRLWVALQNELYVYEAGRWTPASRILHTNKPILARRVLNDKNRTMWFGADEGLNYYEYHAGTIGSLVNDPSNPRSLSGNSILSLYEDREGILWVGTYDGINKYAPAEFKFRHVKWSTTKVLSVGWNKIRSFCEDRSGRIWVATQEGLMTYDDRTESLTRIQNDDWYSPSNNLRLLWSVLEDRWSASPTLWVGTNGQGLIRLEVDRNGASRYVQYLPRTGDSQSLSGPSPVTLYQTRDGTVWVGNLWEGLNRFNRATDTFTRYAYDPTNPESISGNEIWALCEDRSGFLWIGTAGEGLNKFDRSTGVFTRFRHDPRDPRSLSDDKVLAIVGDTSGVLWIGTYSGLNRFDPAKGIFEHFTMRDGLPNDVVYGIVDDRRGNLWLSTNNGLSRFATGSRTFRNYDAVDGLQSNEFNHGAAYRCRDGRILFGGIDGFNIFSPDSLKQDTVSAQVVLTDFKVFNKSILPSSSEKRLSTDIAYADVIHLSHNDNVLSFEFAALEFTNPRKNQYAYTMEGFDGDWVLAGPKREATYTNLDPGEYTFRVKAANSDGIWNEKRTSLRIVISPPYWQTWWFRSVILLAFLSIGPFIYYRRVSALKKRQIIREEFSRRLIESQEAERKRVAAELHDSIGQDLLVIKNKLVLGLQSGHQPKESLKDFQDAVDHVSDSLKHVREISRNLRPIQLDQIGLTAALESAVETAAESSQLRATIHIGNIDHLLGKEQEINLFRIVQESLNNILKHAHATALTVNLQTSGGQLSLEITDNGRGFQTIDEGKRSLAGLGLSSMHERARILGGELRLESVPGKGTTITLRLPVEGRENV